MNFLLYGVDCSVFGDTDMTAVFLSKMPNTENKWKH